MTATITWNNEGRMIGIWPWRLIRIWNETIMAYFTVYSSIRVAETEKNHAGIISTITTTMSIDQSLSLWSIALWALDAFLVFWSYTQSVGLLGRGISPSQGRYLHTRQHEHWISAHRHPCFQRVKRVHTLELSATVICSTDNYSIYFLIFNYGFTTPNVKYIQIVSTFGIKGWYLIEIHSHTVL
jgi:hypothetical protein